MRVGLAAIAALVLALPGAARAQTVEPGVTGTWVASMMGFDMVLSIDADGSCVLDQERGRCTARDGTLVWSGADGSEQYQYTLGGDTLTISGGDMERAVTFQRRGAPAKSPPPAARKPAPPAPAETAPPPAKGGQPFSKPGWGVKLTAPPGWKLAEREGVVLGGSDSEAGLLIIRYEPRATRDQMVAEYQKGLHEQGISAAPTSEARSWKGGSASGLAGELAGTTSDGQAVKIRTIALLNGYGGALIVVGLTTADKYPNLKTRVEQLASTVVMQKPKEAPGGAIAGAYAFIYVSQVGSYSREAYLTLCRSGRFTRRGEMVGSAELSGGARGNAYSGNTNAGTWEAHGDGAGGTLILQFGDGSSAQVNYRVSQDPKDKSGYGPGVYFGNDLYQKTGGGDC